MPPRSPRNNEFRRDVIATVATRGEYKGATCKVWLLTLTCLHQLVRLRTRYGTAPRFGECEFCAARVRDAKLP